MCASQLLGNFPSYSSHNAFQRAQLKFAVTIKRIFFFIPGHESNFTNLRSNFMCSQINRNTFSSLDSVLMLPTVSDQPSKPRLYSETCIDSYSKLTPRWGFESTRLTLLWSQSTTGNYFEGESALSIGFHFRNIVAEDELEVLDVLNWRTLNNKSRHVHQRPHPRL